MKSILTSLTFKILVTTIGLIGNLAFYLWGAPNDSGFAYAWDVHPLFGIFMGLIAAGFFGGYLYTVIKHIRK